MKKYLLIASIGVFALVSCGSENSAEHNSNEDAPTTDTNIANEPTEELKYRLIQSDVAIVNQYGEDSLITDEDGNLSFLYPVPDTIWFNSENE